MSSWFTKLKKDWLTELVNVFHAILTNAFWDSENYLWDSVICTWDGVSDDAFQESDKKDWQSKSKPDWHTPN